MEEIIFELETVTPLFIAGAVQRNIENEGLRAPSLRGLLRWWFRAIMGGMTSIDCLKILENEIFGSTKISSTVKIKTTIEEISSLKFIKEEYYMKYYRHCYAPGSKFEAYIYSRDKTKLNIALCSLWAAIILGGVGGRSRRGGGSLRVVKVNNNNTRHAQLDKSLPTFIIEGSNAKEVGNSISENLSKVYDLFANYCKFQNCFCPPKTKPNFCILSKETASIHVLQHPRDPYRDYKDGLNYVFQKYRQFKHSRLLGGISPRKASPLLIGILKTNRGYFVKLVEFYTSVLQNENQGDLKNIFDKLNKELGKIEEITIPEVR